MSDTKDKDNDKDNKLISNIKIKIIGVKIMTELGVG